MRRAFALLALGACLFLAAGEVGAAAAYKCVVNGAVTYQQGPCPSDQARKLPTVEELNAEERKRRAAAARQPRQATPAVVAGPALVAAPAVVAAPAGFACDGRRYCSQMKSCAEAKYFLAKCPGVSMDGDRNGVPCEQ